MTKPKDATQQRRLLIDPRDRTRRSVSEVLDWLEWATEDAREIPTMLARTHYLRALSRATPRVLDELKRIRIDDEAEIGSWATKWKLGKWAPAWARSTIQLSGGRYWCPPTEGKGKLLETPNPTRRRRTPADIAASALLIHPECFDWLVRFRAL